MILSNLIISMIVFNMSEQCYSSPFSFHCLQFELQHFLGAIFCFSGDLLSLELYIKNKSKEGYFCSMQQQQGFGFCALQERSCTSGNNASEKVAYLFPSLQHYISLHIFNFIFVMKGMEGCFSPW